MTTAPSALFPRTRWRDLGQGLAFTLLGLALGGILIATGKELYALQGGMSSLATLLPLGYAFAAGMVATVNPCGVLLLPSLVAFYLSRDAAAPSGLERAGRALLLGLMATLGFVLLFALVGAVIGLGGRALVEAFPIGGLLVGVALTALGAWLALTGRELGILAASRALGHVQLSTDLRALFLFGVAYALTSLSCTLPIFLVVAGSALARGGLLGALGQFVSYALGMGLVLTAVALGAAFFQGAVARSVRRLVPYVHRLAAAFLIGAGLFLVNYWLSSGLLFR